LLPLLADRVIGLKQGRIAFDLPTVAVDEKKLLEFYVADAAG
jgi:phosphonate transport system ATP-binding protein